MKSSAKGKRASYAFVFLLLCIAITSIAVQAPDNNDDEKGITKNEIYEEEVSSDFIVEDDEIIVTKEDNDHVEYVENEQEQNDVEEIIVDFDKPVSGNVICRYSMNTPVYSKTMDDYRTHKGIDLKVNDDEVVYAAEKGIVIYAERDDLMGETIRIKHLNDNITVYSGLKSTNDIVEGQFIEKGEIIGKAGGSIPVEDSEERHLHFELIIGGIYVNPEDYIYN